ncbi:MAG: hypothetical protein GX881_02845 [Firmicutes bacterium]|nr:hypothetical protein [Bacillota bacterium]
MNCPDCGRVTQGGRNTCPWCGVLVTNPDAGVVASPGRRLGGHILDMAVWAFLWFVIVTTFAGGAETDDGGKMSLGLLLLLASITCYLILLSRGKSYGKWLLGMRTFHTSGKPAGFWIMLLRETIGKFISGMVFSLGFLWLLWDPDHQTWHDKLVSTVVMSPNRHRESLEL